MRPSIPAVTLALLLAVPTAVEAARPVSAASWTLPTSQYVLQSIGYVERHLVRASRAIDRTRDAVSLQPSSVNQNYLAQAQDAYEAGVAAFRRGELIAARQQADRAWDLCRRVLMVADDAESVRRQVNRATFSTEALGRRSARTTDAQVSGSLEAARKSVAEAREAYLLGKTGVAQAQAKTANLAAQKGMKRLDALEDGGQTDDRARARTRIEKADELARSAETKVGASPDLLGIRLLEESRRYLTLARAYYGRGLFASAAANARLSTRLAEHARARLAARSARSK